MNRYKSGGPSKASATTLCQKCLKRGHYSYECSASQQDRPYTSRPSRTQQLLNPRLAPKITNEAPQAKDESNGSRKRTTENTERDRPPSRSKRAISESSDSDSVATISTRSSRSPSPAREHSINEFVQSSRRRSSANLDHGRAAETGSRRRSRSPQGDHRTLGSPSSGSVSRRRDGDRGRDTVPTNVRNAYRSRSPYIERRDDYSKGGKANVLERPSKRDRSLSPYSRRVAMTQATQAGG